MKNNIIFLLIMMLNIINHTAYAEDINREKQAKASIASIAKNPSKNYISISYENDLIGDGSDQFYTSGIQVNYFNVESKPPVLVKRVVDSWLGFDIGDATATSFTLGQKIFTPQNINISTPQNQARPWAGWLYGSVGLTNVYPTHVDQFGVTLGVVGPASLAEQTQTFIHKHITDSPKPMGWNNQLHTEPGLILSWDRRWPIVLAADIDGYRLRVEPNAGIAIGNVSTFAGVGGTMTFGPNQKQLQDTPPRLPPAMAGTGYFDTPQNRDWDWYLFTGLNGRVVARDIFLDGNSFRDSAAIDKKRFVMDANAGAAITYGDTRLAYTLIYRTKEFYGQSDPAIFGSLSLTRRF